jgi:hypothetical protein
MLIAFSFHPAPHHSLPEQSSQLTYQLKAAVRYSLTPLGVTNWNAQNREFAKNLDGAISERN